MNLQSQTGCEAVILLTTAVVKNKVETQGLSGVINTLQGDDSGEKKRTLLFTYYPGAVRQRDDSSHTLGAIICRQPSIFHTSDSFLIKGRILNYLRLHVLFVYSHCGWFSLLSKEALIGQTSQ